MMGIETGDHHETCASCGQGHYVSKDVSDEVKLINLISQRLVAAADDNPNGGNEPYSTRFGG